MPMSTRSQQGDRAAVLILVSVKELQIFAELVCVVQEERGVEWVRREKDAITLRTFILLVVAKCTNMSA